MTHMPTNPDPTQGNGGPESAAFAAGSEIVSKDVAKSGGLLSKLKALQETINDLQQQLSDITEDLEGRE
jgi:hypothetical protein